MQLPFKCAFERFNICRESYGMNDRKHFIIRSLLTHRWPEGREIWCYKIITSHITQTLFLYNTEGCTVMEVTAMVCCVVKTCGEPQNKISYPRNWHIKFCADLIGQCDCWKCITVGIYSKRKHFCSKYVGITIPCVLVHESENIKSV